MTNIWPRNARFVQCFAKVSSPLWERVMGTTLQAADDLPASLLRKVCQCEEGKTKFMGLEMSRHRTIWLSFQMTETAGKKGAVPDFLTLFMLLSSWIKATGKIQKSSPAHTPPPLSSNMSHLSSLLFFLALWVTPCTISSMVTPDWNQANTSVGYSFITMSWW